MKYQWKQNKSIAQEIEREVGVKVVSVTEGFIITGYQEEVDESGQRIQRPIFEQGIEIEFEKELTEEQLTRLDITFGAQGMSREGGKKLANEIAELKERIKSTK